MSLDGAQLNFVNAAGVSVAHAAKGRELKVGSYLGCDLVLPDAERVHCEIKCDAFGRVSIYNHSRNEPILLNDQVVHATAKRPLLHGARIKILNEVYTWHFPKSEELGTPERAPPEQAANSSPSLKGNRQRRQFDNRLTVHNFRYSINSDDDGNTSIESRELETSSSSNSAEISATAEPDPSITPPGKDADETEPKVDLLEATQNKENTSTLGNKLMLQLCARSDVVITSFSPRETGVKIEKSFTAVMKPTSGMRIASTATTPKSVYNTPKSVLSELNDESCSRDLPEFSTPSTSKKALAGKRPTSMYLVDLTTPQKLRPTLSVTPKQTPGSVGVISVNSTDESSDSSVLVIDITNSSTPTTASAKQPQRRVVNTPKEQLLAAGSTPKRTPQSLMKRALLTSAKKQIAANSRTPTTPLDATKRQSLLDARRQCLTAPRRLPFHPHPQWRTPGRRQIPAVNVKEPQTSPRKRPSLSLSSPRENKISKMRKTLAANAKISPNVGMSNKLVAKARRALNSPKQESPKARRSAYSPKPESPNRIGSPKLGTPKANQPQDFELIESSTPDRAENSNAELSLTFTIDDEQNATGPALEALIHTEDAANESQKLYLDSILDENESRQSKVTEVELKLNESSTKDSPLPSPIDAEACEIVNLNEASDEETLNRTYDLNVSQEKSNLELSTADIEQLSNSKVANESSVIDKNCAADKPSIQLEKSDENLTTDPINKSLGKAEEVVVIDDNICEEVPTTSNYQEDLVTITDEHLAEDTICEEVPTNEDTICEEVPTNEEDIFTNDNADNPGFTPRRSLRRSTIEVRNKLEQSLKKTRRASCSGVVESQRHKAVVATPNRKRRLTDELPTSSRKSQRLLSNTPKRALSVDESVGDMGVIVEEDAVSADKFPTVTDEDYGTELTTKDTEEPDKIDYHGMRELLKTPKSCSTPHFKGLREMIRTPKEHPSAIVGNIEELLDASTPKRSVTVSRVALELSKSETQDMYFKTPRGRNLMVPNDPASAVLKSIDKSLATTTEYDLNATNATLHLDKIFDDVLAVEPTDPSVTGEDSENEINVTAISTATVSETDPLSTSNTPTVEPSDSVRSEALMNISHAETSHKDPLTSTAFKKGGEIELHQDAPNDDRPQSPGICDLSGIQMLDRTTDSMFSEPLVVTGVDSCDVTLEETKPAGIVTKTTKNDMLDEGSDTDSMVGLSEPLVLSDDEADVEEVELDSQEQVKETNVNESIIPLNDSRIDDELISNKNEADVAKESSVNKEKSIDLTEEESTLDDTQDELASSKEQEQVKESNANESIIPLNDSRIDDELISNKNEAVAAKESSVNEEKSIDLTEEESTLDDTQDELASSKDQKQVKESNANESIIPINDSRIDDELISNKNEADAAKESSVNEEKSIDLTEEESTLDTTQEQIEKSNADESLISLNDSQTDDELIINQKEDKNEADIAKESSVNEEKSIDLTEEESTLDDTQDELASSKEQKNDQDAEATAADTSCIQMDSQIESEFAIDLEASGLATTTDESLAQADVTKTSTIYGADLSLAAETKPADDSLINASSNIQDKDTNEEDFIIELDASNADNKNSEIQLDRKVSTEADKVEDIRVEENSKAQSVPTNPDECDVNKQSSDEPETDQKAEETSPELPTKYESLIDAISSVPKSDIHQKEVQEEAATSADEILLQNESVQNIESIEESQEEKQSDKESSENGNDKEQSSEQNVQLVNEIENESKVVTICDVSNATKDELAPQLVTESAEELSSETKEVKADVELASESTSVLDASVVAEEQVEEQEIEPKTQVDRKTNTSEELVKEQAADESVIDLDAETEEEDQLYERLPEIVSKSMDKLDHENNGQDNVEATNVDKSLVEMHPSVVVELKTGEQHADQIAENLSTSSGKSLNEPDEEIQSADLAATREDDAEKAESQPAVETLTTSAEAETEANLESENAGESLLEVDASIVTGTEKEEEHLDQSAAETLPKSAEVLSAPDMIEDKNKADLESTNAEKSLVEVDASVAAETEKVEHLDQQAAEILSTSTVKIEDQPKAEIESTNAEESLVEIDSSVVIETEKKEENLSEEVVTTLSKSPEVPSNQNETVNKSQAEVESTNDDECMAEMDASVAVETETEKREADLDSMNADESFVEKDASVAVETENREENLDESAVKTLSTSLEVPSDQNEIVNNSQIEIESTNADESLVEIDSSVAVETEKREEHLDESAAKSLSTSEVPSNEDNNENKTQEEVESKPGATRVPETQKTEELVKEQAADDSIIDLDSETDEEEKQLHEHLPEIISKSPKKTSNKLDDENKAQDVVKAKNVDDSLIEKGDEQLSMSAMPSTSAEKSLNESLNEINPEVEVDGTNVDDSLVKLDASVVSKDEKESEQLNVSEIQSTSAENASGNEAKVNLKSTTANDTLVEQDAIGIAETEKSLVDLDRRDSASKSAETQDPPNANEAESRVKENPLTEISANVSEKAQTEASLDKNGVEKAEHDESKGVSDVLEPSTKIPEPETEQKSALNDSIVEDLDLNKQDVVAELSMTAEVKTKSGNKIVLDYLSKTEKASPEVLSSKIVDNSAVIDLDASCVVEIQSLEPNLKGESVAVNPEEKQASDEVETKELNASSVAKINANTLDEVQDKTDQTKASKAPEEDNKSTEVVEPTTQIIESKVEDKNSAISMEKIPKKGRSRKSSTAEDFGTEPTEIKLTKRTRKPSVALELKETHVQTKDQKPNNVHKAEEEVAEEVAAVSSHVDKKETTEIHSEKPKRRGRKPTAEVVEIEDKIEEKVEQPNDLDKPKQQLQESPAEAPVEEKKEEHVDLDKPKQRGRKLATVVEAKAKVEEKVNTAVDLEKHKGRGRKPSAGVVEIKDKIEEKVEQPIDIDEPKQRLQESPVENVDYEASVEEKMEEHIDSDKPKQRGRKLQKEVKTEAKIEDNMEKAVDLEKQKGRGRKPSAGVVEIEDKIEEKVEQPTDIDEPKQRLQESPAENVDYEAPVEEKKEEHIDLDKPKQRGRKLATAVEAETKAEAVDLEKQKGRGRKPSVEVVENAEHADGKSQQIEELDKPKRRGRGKPASEVVETEAHAKESSDKQVELDKPKRRGQTPSGEVVKTKTQSEEVIEKTVDLDKPKRRLRKPSAEVVETEKHGEEKSKQKDDLNKPKRRGRKPSAEVVETEPHIEEKREDTIEPKRRGRKPSADVAKSEAHAEKNTEDTVDHDKPKRRVQKASADVPSAEPQEDSEHATHTEEVVEVKPKRRYRKASAEVTDEVETVELPAKRASRNARKASAETVESDKTSKDHLSVIDESGEPAEKRSRLKETAELDTANNVKRHGRKQSPSADVVPEEEPLAETVSVVVVKEVEPLSKPLQKIGEASDARLKGSTRRGRKATVDEEAPVVVEASVPHNKGPTRRGRKATVDEEVLTVVEASASHNKGSTRRGRKVTTDEEVPTVVEATGSDDKSSTRRGRKATAEEETSTAQPVETAEVKPKRRGRNASADVAHAEAQTPATTEKPKRRARKPSVDVSAAAEPPAEKKNTRRVRNLSTNVDITVEEAPQPKKTTARRGRKASVSVAADEVTKQFDIQSLHVEPIETAAIVSVMVSPKPQVLSSEDELTPRRREGRNLPRKNYDETSDEDRAGSSRKARKPVATKAAVTTTTTPAEPGTSPLPKPSTPLPSKPVEPVVEVRTPVAPIVLPDPTSSQKREGRNMPRKNYSETSDDDKPSTSRGRRVRQPTIKALEQLVDTAARPATPKRRVGKAKAAAESADDHTEEPPEKKVAVEESTPVQPAKRNTRKAKIIVDEVGDQQPAPKKPRGGARAKTPATVEVEKIHEVEEPKEVPATKRAAPARGRAARAVKVVDEAEIVQETPPPSRTGRGRKVHFETTEEVATAAKEDQPAAAEAPKRATRSRRK